MRALFALLLLVACDKPIPAEPYHCPEKPCRIGYHTVVELTPKGTVFYCWCAENSPAFPAL